MDHRRVDVGAQVVRDPALVAPGPALELGASWARGRSSCPPAARVGDQVHVGGDGRGGGSEGEERSRGEGAGSAHVGGLRNVSTISLTDSVQRFWESRYEMPQ